MDEDDFKKIINEFCSFENKFSEDINSSSIKSGNCYLIEEYWIDEFKNSINNYNKNKNKKVKDHSEFIPDYITMINFFSTIINYLQNNKKFGFVSKKLLEYSYEEDDLKSDICSKYYTGNNKLIIELKDDKDNKNNNSILLIDPLNKDKIEKRAYIISSQKEKRDKSFYESLIEKDIFNNKSEEIGNDFAIFPFEKYSNILKFLIHINFYERALIKNSLNVFEDKKNENYYLINNDWMVNFKKYYNYESLYIKLKKGEEINYNNLNQKFEYIYSTKSALDYNLKNLYEEINNVDKIKAIQSSNSKIPFENAHNAYIINSQMKELIESILDKREIDLPKNKIDVKNNNSYLICGKKIRIGNLNKYLCFREKYIFSYNTEELLESEKNSLFESSIENYINSINCNINKFDVQKIKRNNKTIGTLIILTNKKLSVNNNIHIAGNKGKEDSKNDLKERKHKKLISQRNYDSSQAQNELDLLEEIKEYKNKIKEFEEKEKKFKELEEKKFKELEEKNKILEENEKLSKKLEKKK